MRINIIKTIFLKEIKDIFRDKKTIFMMIVLPILLYPILMIAGMQVGSVVATQMQEAEYTIAVGKQVAPELISFAEDEETYEYLNFTQVEDYKVALAEERIDVYIDGEGVANQQNYAIYYNSADSNANIAVNHLKGLLEDFSNHLTINVLEAEGLDAERVLVPFTYETIDLAQMEEKAGELLASILPLILMLGIFMGAIYPAIDVMAGEKERGTIETLLTLPVSNLELVMGKYIAVAVVALMSSLLNLLSIGLSLLLIIVSVDSAVAFGGQSLNINMGEFVIPIMITVISVLIFTLVVCAVSMSVCAMAKSFKEAQNYTTPLMLVLLLPTYVVMIPTIKLTAATASIPVVNIVLLIKSVLTFEYDLGLIMLVLVSNFAFMILSILLLARVFDSEDVLFGSGKEFSLLQRRYNIKKGTLPTPGDAWILYGVGLLALLYLGSIYQLKLGFWGLAATQVTLVALPIVYGVYIKTDFKKALSLNLPKINEVFGAIIIWAGLFFIVNGVSHILMPLSEQNQEVAKQLAKLTYHPNIWINLLVVAVLPAICEEILFRGMIYKGIENKRFGKRAIVVTGILFGLMHLDFIRMIPTALLGFGLAYVVYKTQSILLPMLMHFLNNALVVWVGHIPVEETTEVANVSGGLILSMLAVGSIILIAGIILLGKGRDREDNLIR